MDCYFIKNDEPIKIPNESLELPNNFINIVQNVKNIFTTAKIEYKEKNKSYEDFIDFLFDYTIENLKSIKEINEDFDIFCSAREDNFFNLFLFDSKKPDKEYEFSYNIEGEMIFIMEGYSDDE